MSLRTGRRIASLLFLISIGLVSCVTPVADVEKLAQTSGAEIVEAEADHQATEAPETFVSAPPLLMPSPTVSRYAPISPTFKNPDTLIFVEGGGEPESLDPAWTYETAGAAVQDNIYEGLIWYAQARTDAFVPMLATQWETDETGKTWTFQIRQDVTFHRGGTLEAHDVAYSIHRALLQDRLDGPQWMMLEALFGVYTIEDLAMRNYALAHNIALDSEAYAALTFKGLDSEALLTTCAMVKSAVVADDEAGTVTYNLTQSTPWFLSMIANKFLGAVVDKAWMLEQGAWDDSCANWTQWHDPAPQDTVLFDQANGTGPYMLQNWIPGEDIVLVANEQYWRTAPIWEEGPSGVARIKRVIIKNVPEWGTRLAMFEAGDADAVAASPQYRSYLAPYYRTVCEADGTCEIVNPEGYILIYRNLPKNVLVPAQFNWKISKEGGNPFLGSGKLDGNGIPGDFFSDIHIRKAFNYCFNFDALIADALSGEAVQGQGPIIADMMGYLDEAPLYNYDPAKCEQDFRKAWDGQVWENGFYMQSAYNLGNETRRVASEILQASIEAINPKFHLEVVGMPWPVLLDARRTNKLPLYIGGWLEDFHDPHNWVHAFLHSQGAYGRVINMSKDKARVFDAWIEEAALSTDLEVRKSLYENIQRAAQEEAINIWMYQPVGRVHFQAWVKGYYYNSAYASPSHSYVYALSKSPVPVRTGKP